MALPFERVTVKATLVPKLEVVKETAANRNLLVFEVSDQIVKLLRRYITENKGAMDQRLTFSVWDDDWTERAKNFMFLVRDRVCSLQKDSGKANKDHLYVAAKFEAGFTLEDGEVRSLKSLNSRELWELTRLLMDWAAQAAEAEGGTVEDLRSEYIQLGDELNAEEKLPD